MNGQKQKGFITNKMQLAIAGWLAILSCDSVVVVGPLTPHKVRQNSHKYEYWRVLCPMSFYSYRKSHCKNVYKERHILFLGLLSGSSGSETLQSTGSQPLGCLNSNRTSMQSSRVPPARLVDPNEPKWSPWMDQTDHLVNWPRQCVTLVWEKETLRGRGPGLACKVSKT